MSSVGQLSLRDRKFIVTAASVSLQAGLWTIDIQAHAQEFDGEDWAPRLYHQGLKLAAASVSELAGLVVRWADPPEPSYVHPEFGFMYVFGHHSVQNSSLTFREASDGQVEVEWKGDCDVLWSEEFGENVPFWCRCLASVHAG